MTRTSTRFAAGLAAAAAIVALSSCSTATDTKDKAASASSAAEAAAGSAHNSEDVMFLQMMIPHHEQAIQLGAMVPQHTSNAELIKLAAEILKAQQPEINTMKSQLSQWGVDPGESPHGSGHDGMTMQGMVNDETMVKLDTLKGAEFDKLWLQSMISHHEGAVAMAKTEIADGKNSDMKALAESIVSGQQTEIDQMKKMLAAAGG